MIVSCPHRLEPYRCKSPHYSKLTIDPKYPLKSDVEIARTVLPKLQISNGTQPVNPRVIFWTDATTEKKRRAFYNPSSKILYFIESRKSLLDPEKFQGNSKKGNLVFSQFLFNPQANTFASLREPLLMLSNHKLEHLVPIRLDIAVAKELSQKIPDVQEPIDSFEWVSRKGHSKIAFFCIRQPTCLFDIIKAQYTKTPDKSKFPLTLCRSIQEQMTNVLAAVANEGFIYRDPKLENFLLSGDGKTITLIDFETCSRKHFEPIGWEGSVTTIAPEYAFLYRLTSVFRKYPPPPEILSAVVNEKNTVFSLGMMFLMMTFPPELEHLRPMQKAVMKNDSPSEHMFVRSEWTSQEFRDYLSLLDPSMPKTSFPCKNPITEKSPASTDFWPLLLEQMLAPDPRNRPTLAEVAEKMKPFAQHKTEEQNRALTLSEAEKLPTTPPVARGKGNPCNRLSYCSLM